MIKSKITLVFISAMLFSVCASAADIKRGTVLTIDQPVVDHSELRFDVESSIEPEKSDFSIVSYTLMSSPSGERWAVLTLKNKSIGHRLLNIKQVVAIFANGERRFPLELDGRISAKDVVTKTIFFSLSKFPILSLQVKGNKTNN